MNELDLKKLSKQELIAFIMTQEAEIDELKQQLQSAQEELESKKLSINEAGSIAEAALKVNGVFEAAEAAAAQYLDNIRDLSQRQEQLSRTLLDESKRKAKAMLEEAIHQRDNIKREADGYWDEMSSRLEKFYEEHKGLRELLQLEAAEK